MVDAKGGNQARYEKDLAECREYAKANPDTDSKKAMKKGAVSMGVESGAVMGVAAIATGGLLLIPMIAGAVASSAGMGAYMGKTEADVHYKNTVTSCLKGRGHKVLE